MAESWSVGSLRMRASLRYSRTRIVRFRSCLILCAMLFVLCFPVQAQQSGKMIRIGFLDPSTASGMAVLVDAFRRDLGTLGWIEGKNIKIEYRFAEQKLDRVQDLAADLVRQKLDLIIVSGTPAAIAAKKETTTIPIVVAAARTPTERSSKGGCRVETAFRGNRDSTECQRPGERVPTISNVSRVGILRPPGESLGRRSRNRNRSMES